MGRTALDILEEMLRQAIGDRDEDYMDRISKAAQRRTGKRARLIDRAAHCFWKAITCENYALPGAAANEARGERAMDKLGGR